MNETLMEILADPEREGTLRKDEIYELIGEVAVLDARLRARLADLGRDQNLPGKEECDLLTVEQAAKRLAVTEPYVYELLKSGGLPFIGIGKYKHIRPGDLRDWIDRHREDCVDGNIYFKYNHRHGGRRVSKDTKAAEPHASQIRGPDRR